MAPSAQPTGQARQGERDAVDLGRVRLRDQTESASARDGPPDAAIAAALVRCIATREIADLGRLKFGRPRSFVIIIIITTPPSLV